MHLNSSGSFTIQNKRPYPRLQNLTISGGKTISQFNKDEPISALANEVYTLIDKKNYMKLYETGSAISISITVTIMVYHGVYI